MKNIVVLCILGFWCHLSFGQNEAYKAMEKRYELYLKRKEKDTTIIKRYHTYSCGKEMSGRLTFYMDKDTLRLIQHAYKQGQYDEYHSELYYIEEGRLVLQTTYTEIIHYNSYSQQSAVQNSATIEKVLELVEERVGYPATEEPQCYNRRFGAKASEWDQSYFENLPFQKRSCAQTKEVIEERYRMLLKAERFFRKKITQNPPCIFHIW